jgi:hypothetical protein
VTQMLGNRRKLGPISVCRGNRALQTKGVSHYLGIGQGVRGWKGRAPCWDLVHGYGDLLHVDRHLVYIHVAHTCRRIRQGIAQKFRRKSISYFCRRIL